MKLNLTKEEVKKLNFWLGQLADEMNYKQRDFNFKTDDNPKHLMESLKDLFQRSWTQREILKHKLNKLEARLNPAVELAVKAQEKLDQRPWVRD